MEIIAMDIITVFKCENEKQRDKLVKYLEDNGILFEYAEDYVIDVYNHSMIKDVLNMYIRAMNRIFNTEIEIVECDY